jgi:hypothetical protein
LALRGGEKKQSGEDKEDSDWRGDTLHVLPP